MKKIFPIIIAFCGIMVVNASMILPPQEGEEGATCPLLTEGRYGVIKDKECVAVEPEREACLNHYHGEQCIVEDKAGICLGNFWATTCKLHANLEACKDKKAGESCSAHFEEPRGFTTAGACDQGKHALECKPKGGRTNVIQPMQPGNTSPGAQCSIHPCGTYMCADYIMDGTYNEKGECIERRYQ